MEWSVHCLYHGGGFIVQVAAMVNRKQPGILTVIVVHCLPRLCLELELSKVVYQLKVVRHQLKVVWH